MALGEGLRVEEVPFREGVESMDSGFLVALEVVLRLGGLVLVVLRAVLWVALGRAVLRHQDRWGRWGRQKEVDNGYLDYRQIPFRRIENLVVRRSI